MSNTRLLSDGLVVQVHPVPPNLIEWIQHNGCKTSKPEKTTPKTSKRKRHGAWGFI